MNEVGIQALDFNFTLFDQPRPPATCLSFNMASGPSALPSHNEPVYESVESLLAQIKGIEDRWNDEVERLETARKDKEELEQILQVLQTLVAHEHAATLKMEAMLREMRDVVCAPDEASRPPETVYDPSRTTGSSSSGDSSVLEFDLVYNPNATLVVPLEASSAPPPPSLPDTSDQAIPVPPLLETPIKLASKPKTSPGWRNKITSILISTNSQNRTNPLSPSSRFSASPFSDDASSHDAKPKPATRPQKRPLQDSENHGTAGRKGTMGSARKKFANRANREINRKKPSSLAPIPQN